MQVIGLSSPNTIIVVASDHGLRRSLAFALEVEGFEVVACETWQQATQHAKSALGLIVDSEIFRLDASARQSLLDPEHKIILLADGMLPALVHANAKVLTKPCEGSDLMVAVGELFRVPK